jgi:hypothetical protein
VNPLEDEAGYARVQRFDIEHDVGQFGHGSLWRESYSPVMMEAPRKTGQQPASSKSVCGSFS